MNKPSTPTTIEVLTPGMQTTVQDYPGRLGYWDVGVPPSGPMDNLAFLFGNRILGNPDHAPGLEITLTGPTLKFHGQCVLALTGAPMQATLNDTDIPFWKAVSVKAGSILKITGLTGSGARAYLCIQQGLAVEEYLGSRSTFTLGQFGGYMGRALQRGDVLQIEPAKAGGNCQYISQKAIPVYKNHWDIHVLYGPHGAPDFFTTQDIDTFFNYDWKVHHNSSRTGVRLIGPRPQWAREDGGEAGLHPSNIHDNAYAIGAIDYTGDMPVILGPDGPSLGGFVCPATIIKADLWKMGQLKAGNTVRFIPVDLDTAIQLYRLQVQEIATLMPSESIIVIDECSPAILAHGQFAEDLPEVCYRLSGEDNILVEYGPMVLDLNLRFRVHALMQWIKEREIPGIIDLTPGIRSLQIHHDNLILSTDALLEQLTQAESELPSIDEIQVPSRIVHLPLSWDDPSTRKAINIYMQSVRADAPWCPGNIEFIRRVNGLDSIDEVKDIVFNASYLVLGLGDVYLGAPVATPVDPRHRLVTTKYNPARTWTPENAVGIGGAYLCVYGMEGPGGYQFVGRTLQMWNHKNIVSAEFEAGKPWLLRFFDQIRFYPVTENELLEIREKFPQGKYSLKIEESIFDLNTYNRFLQDNEKSIATFKQNQQAAFSAERQRWQQQGEMRSAGEQDAVSRAGNS